LRNLPSAGHAPLTGPRHRRGMTLLCRACRHAGELMFLKNNKLFYIN